MPERLLFLVSMKLRDPQVEMFRPPVKLLLLRIMKTSGLSLPSVHMASGMVPKKGGTQSHG